MSNIRGVEGSFSSGHQVQQHQENQQLQNKSIGSGPGPTKKKRSLPGTPDPMSEVIALSPTTLMTTNRFVCEICNKGFPRDQNLQLHKRGHNLPWRLLRQRTTTEFKRRVYICPEPTCVHHNPARALGDLTGVKKHYSRKHGEKKWKCDKCSKKYAVQSDWKAHQKICGTREYICDCGTIFSRRDSFITHRAFCDALAVENSKTMQGVTGPMGPNLETQMPDIRPEFTGLSEFINPIKSLPLELIPIPFRPTNMARMFSSTVFGSSPRSMSSSSSSSGLQLSSNAGPSSYTFHQDNKLGQISGLSNMSNSMSSSFVSSMTSPYQISRPGPGHRPISSVHKIDTFRSPNHHSPPSNGGFMQDNTEEVAAQLFESDRCGGSAVKDIMMYGGMLIGHQNLPVEFSKDVVKVHEESDRNSRIVHGRRNNMMLRSPARLLGGDAMTTVDFLGVGGSGPLNLGDQILDSGGMNQQRMQALMHNYINKPFHHEDWFHAK